ncbi:MAG: hypothetical protein Q8O62_09990 [Aequorivita sp.]|nr:hypothetical protein [Aequorivita sp.]
MEISTGGTQNPPKLWKQINWGDCDRCGDDAEVLTTENRPDWVNEGDEAICVGCGLKGIAIADESEGAHIDWNEFDAEVE